MKLLIALLTVTAILGTYHILPNRAANVDQWSLTGNVPVSGRHADTAAPSTIAAPAESVGSALTKSSVKELDKPASILDETVGKWKMALAREMGFENWDKAEWSSFTLGPGSHGWVVILNHDGKEIGYMIIHAAENGELRLTEYGTGSSPLFSFNTLYQSLIQLGLIPHTSSFDEFSQAKNVSWERWYLGALHGLWKITSDGTVYVLDAKTGEALPLNRLPLLKREAVSLPAGSSLSGQLEEQLLPVFDPYERLPWVQGTPLSISSLQELKEALQTNPKLTYVMQRYDGKLTSAFAVRGYRKWEKDEPYLIVDQKGPSYVPLHSALADGSIYP